MQDSRIQVGCWVETVHWGPAVVTSVDDEGITLRYEAIRKTTEETIWVANGLSWPYIEFLQGPDSVSQHVLTLKGPYG